MSVGSPLLNVAPPILATLNGVRAIEIILREVSSIGGLPRSDMDQPDGRRVARPAKPDSPGPAVHAYTMTIANGKRHSNRQGHLRASSSFRIDRGRSHNVRPPLMRIVAAANRAASRTENGLAADYIVSSPTLSRQSPATVAVLADK